MPNFQAKPVIVSAFKLIVGAQMPDWFTEGMEAGWIVPAAPDPPLNQWAENGMLVYTKRGIQLADVGDWMIQGVDGEVTVCRGEIFERLYQQPPLQGRRYDTIIMDTLDALDQLDNKP